ncbi:MAG TPA: hypothetical protein VE684_15490 [Crenalkalicoccus sp.]|nr:hypothetical protein [Crenalkalicoccus sp.]
MDVRNDPAPLTVQTQFGRAQACGSGPYVTRMSEMSHRSPAIGVAGLPPGTRSLKVEMVDLDLGGFDHGGGQVAVPAGTGPQAVIPEGALSNWMGPCPPTGSDHRYEVRVRALDAGGHALAGGTTVLTCCRQFGSGRTGQPSG